MRLKQKKKNFFLKYNTISNHFWSKPDCVSTFPQPAEPFTCCGKLISKDKELSLCPYKLPTTFPEPWSHGDSVHLRLHPLSSDVPHYRVPRVSHTSSPGLCS